MILQDMSSSLTAPFDMMLAMRKAKLLFEQVVQAALRDPGDTCNFYLWPCRSQLVSQAVVSPKHSLNFDSSTQDLCQQDRK